MPYPAEGNLFMMCRHIQSSALSDLPQGYHIRLCRREELDLWKSIHFDSEAVAQAQRPFMDEYFDTVYQPQGEAFWQRCFFLCNDQDDPIGTCFAWRAYGKITTIHWYKVKREYEGRGLGRALLSHVMNTLSPSDYPVYLHTHPACLRAIKLYSDFGFSLLTDAVVGYRENDLQAALPYLQENLLPSVYQSLTFSSAEKEFLDAARSSEFSHF